MEARMCFEF